MSDLDMATAVSQKLSLEESKVVVELLLEMDGASSKMVVNEEEDKLDDVGMTTAKQVALI